MYKQLISLNNEEKILDRITTEGHNYAIVLNDNDTLIGNIGFNELEHIGRKATVGLFIGESEHRGKGYGAEASRLLLDYGFKHLNLHNIMLHVNSNNEQGIACYKKVGFREFGRRRESVYVNGQYYDNVHMDILRSEFYS